jgi:hypothetical protein
VGNYFYSISRRSKTVNGVEIAFANFYGKPPGIFGPNAAWNRFHARAELSAIYNADAGIEYVMMCAPGELASETCVPVAEWRGRAMLDDGFWENNTVGYVHRCGHGRYELEWKIPAEADYA